MSKRHFNRHQTPTFKCMTCERMTRDTGQGVDHLCMECFNIAGLDNQVNDSGEPCTPEILAECNHMLKIIEKRGGNIEKVREFNEYIWPVAAPAPAPIAAAKHVKFENVRGYATYENAAKRGQAIADARPDLDYRWVVIALPNGRFTPMVVCNNNVPGGPGNFIGEVNVCIIN
jgi:hypothetical protein